jgi:hypothetical protein
VAPALHSLIVFGCGNAADILQFLFHKHGDLRKLILKHCWFRKDSTELLANIVALYPDLEVLSLKSWHLFTFADYHLIPRLKKLTELKLSYCQVHYMYVQLLETHVCIHEHM